MWKIPEPDLNLCLSISFHSPGNIHLLWLREVGAEEKGRIHVRVQIPGRPRALRFAAPPLVGTPSSPVYSSHCSGGTSETRDSKMTVAKKLTTLEIRFSLLRESGQDPARPTCDCVILCHVYSMWMKTKLKEETRLCLGVYRFQMCFIYLGIILQGYEDDKRQPKKNDKKDELFF